MHHQDIPGDSPGNGSRKTAFHYRSGSGGAPVSSAANPADESQTQTGGSSSPGLHHQHHHQQQPQSQSAAAGAQVKKKSGFQITSVTSAQISVSGNNSLADDTESYDDMDESHTEDLSSSDLLEVSISRATDKGAPERSSSDDTLNSLHGADTPGAVSPNEPIHPHSTPQGSQQHISIVNGSVHHHQPYYSQQIVQSHHHQSDSLGGGEPLLSALPIAPLASSTPSMGSKVGSSKSQRTLLSSAGGTTQAAAHIVGVVVSDANVQGTVNVSNMTAGSGTAVPSPRCAGVDIFNTNASGQMCFAGGGTGIGTSGTHPQSQQPQPQTATGSRFRVVKLDTNSEPFRKGRWLCAEYYEKEVSHAATSDAPKSTELAPESEAGSTGISPGALVVQPPHTLQPYQQPTHDFTSPQTMQSPPQLGLAQTNSVTYVSPQEVASGALMPKSVTSVLSATPKAGGSQPPPLIPQQLPYAVDPHQAQTQGGYSLPQLHTGVMSQGSVRQPDFIQPTAPFQTQVQPPPLHLTSGVALAPVPGVPAQPPVGISQQLPHQGQPAASASATFAAGLPLTLPSQLVPQPQPVQLPSTATVPMSSNQGSTYMPLTALKADLQPLLTPGAGFTQVPGGESSIKSSHLEDAQKLLLQHQGLLGLPRLVRATGGEGVLGASGGAADTLAHMGMSAEASAFMAAAAAGLRNQHAEGEEDR